jgi:hypothetical protein
MELVDGTERFSKNVGKKLPFYVAKISKERRYHSTHIQQDLNSTPLPPRCK